MYPQGKTLTTKPLRCGAAVLMHFRCHYELRVRRRGRFFGGLLSRLRGYGAFWSRAEFTWGDAGVSTKRQHFPRRGILARTEEASWEISPPSMRPRGESFPVLGPQYCTDTIQHCSTAAALDAVRACGPSIAGSFFFIYFRFSNPIFTLFSFHFCCPPSKTYDSCRIHHCTSPLPDTEY